VVAYGLVIPLRMFPCEDGIYGTFLFYVQKEFEPIRYIPTKFRRREVCLFFVAADSVSVLARQRVAQASKAELCRGQSRPQNHNTQFPQYQAT
jgi:hypothetical protein